MSEKIYITHDQIEDIACDRSEQETSINWLRDDELALICTSDYTMVTKIARAMAKDPENYKCYYYETNRDKKTGRLGNYFFEVPKKLINLRSSAGKKKSNKVWTEEERKAVGERFKRGRKAKKELLELN